MNDFPSIDKLLVKSNETLRAAIQTIDYNAQGICFIVDPRSGTMVGLLTDGDIRRALLKGAVLDSCVSDLMQTQFVSLPLNSPSEVIQKKLSEVTKVIPLLDAERRPKDYACIHRFRRIPVAQPSLNGNELAYVTDCIRTNWISSQGSYVQRFQQMFTEYIQIPHALAVANGTVALHLALDALGIGEGDEVIVPDLTFAASINSILYTGAVPLIADVLPDTWTIDPEQVARLITSRTKAIMPVHLYGQPCEMDSLMELARKHKLYIVEDCAEALGSLYKGMPVGSFGDVSTFSFFGNKTITTGEGGMVVCKDPDVFNRASVLRDHGMDKQKRYWHKYVGYNYRMTNLQAAIGVAQMERVDDFVHAKRRLGKKYSEMLSEIKGVVLPKDGGSVFNSYWLYTFLLTDECGVSRDELMEKLLFNGIESRPVFFPLHEMPPYQQYAAPGGYPVTSRISRQGISLPSAVSATDEELNSVCSSIRAIFGLRGIISS